MVIRKKMAHRCIILVIKIRMHEKFYMTNIWNMINLIPYVLIVFLLV